MKTLLDREDLVFNPPELGCVLYLPALPGGGSKIYDRSPYGNHGAITGATWKRLPSGLWYLSFDGSDDLVDCGKHSSLLITGDLTLEFWINLTNLDAGYFVLGQNETPVAYAGVYCVLIDQTTGILRLYRGDGTSEAGAISDSAVPTGWTHIAITMAGTTVKFYFNSSSDASKTLSATIGDTGENIRIGKRQDNLYPLLGGLALLRIYNRVLGAFEIQGHFNREKHLFGVW